MPAARGAQGAYQGGNQALAVRAGVCAAASLLWSLALVAPADAAKRITGKLSVSGAEVVALAYDGQAASVEANGRFKLAPPAKRVTLHLRGADGNYAGPIVVGRKGKSKAIVGVRAGAELGKVKVRDGYAKLAEELPKEDIDARRTARARDGVPIGADTFGRVASTPKGVPGPGQDQDRDGVPGALDVDDDGDLVLDNLDGSSAQARGAQVPTPQGCGADNFYCQSIASSLQSAAFHESANVNAFVLGGLGSAETQQRIDDALVSSGGLRFSPRAEPEELDCGRDDPGTPQREGLTYCSPGNPPSTGETFVGSLPFPGCCDPGPGDPPTGDGYGTLPMPSLLRPRATSAEIKTGQWLNEVVTNADGTETALPASLNFVFVTTPALASYRDSAGNCAKVSGSAGDCTTEFSYPVAADDPGNVNNGFPVAGGPCPPVPPPSCVDGHVVLTLTFWRPQRKPIPRDACLLDDPPCDWVDIGGLTYSAGSGGGCPQDTFSTTDPKLTSPTLPLLGKGGLTDLKDSQRASPENFFTFTLDLTECYLAAQGMSFDPGDQVPIAFEGVSGATDAAAQTVFFMHE